MSALQQQAFRIAASELGMASSAWLFVRETAAAQGEAGVLALRDGMGRAWPVLDAVCLSWLADQREPVIDPNEVLPLLEGVSRLVLVGHESLWLDALMAELPATARVAVLQQGDAHTDWPRVVANYGARVELLQLSDFQSWAGPRSVLMTFVYGHTHEQVFVLPAWLRVAGPDVRLQFRALLGWQVHETPLEVYPRHLVAADVRTLTDLRPAAA